ncbi:stalk domain-containing protein [Paenibacillus nicotianae]|uniref:Stalk domain-containing protein n=1 Tax=Paenibacillus nicotianae TaxID=1526551 RepID=A0ABW4UP35_9BACL
MNKKVGLGILAATLTFGIGTGALAATGLEPIKAYLNSTISLKMNGTTVTPKDANGKAVLPITYNGTTYLPVRAVGTLMGTSITYDPTSSSVIIGSSGNTGTPTTPIENSSQSLSTLGTKVLGSSDWHTKDPSSTVYKDKDYKDVFLYTGVNNQSKSFQIMTENKYSKLHLELASLSGNQKIVIMNQDNTTLKTLSVTPANGMVSVDVDVTNTKAVYLEITDADNDSKLFVPLTTSSLTK